MEKNSDSEVAKVRFNRKKVSFENIVYNRNIECIKKMVADHYGISTDNLLKLIGIPKYRIPRIMALYLCRRLTLSPISEICDAFGRSDHSSVLRACKIIEKDMESNEFLSVEVELLAESIIREVYDKED